MMEAALDGKFEKYLGNDGTSASQGLNSAHGKICLAFAHWDFSVHGRSVGTYRPPR